MPKLHHRDLLQRPAWFFDDSPHGFHVFCLLIAMSAYFLIFGFCVSPFKSILWGLYTIVSSPDRLITDYIALTSMGAAFVNAGLVLLISVAILYFCRLPFTGISIACSFLMAGFALFGKNPINMIPILLGVWIYAQYRKEPYRRFVYIALFGTSLSPAVTEMAVLFSGHPRLAYVMSLILGILIGFILPPVAAFASRAHMGYNLYNVGFASGLICLILVSILRSFGNSIPTLLIWSHGNNLLLSVALVAGFLCMVLDGWLLNGRTFRGLWHLTRHSGRALADFVTLDGFPITLMNMGVLGLLGTGYVLVVGGDLNGPTIGGILTIVGFGAFGKHAKNCFWVVAGVVIASFAMVWHLDEPSSLLAALFATGLAPIAGQFGALPGIIAGMLHASVVLNISELGGGMNLYNNGFSAGLVCMVLVPILEVLTHKGDE